ncbi:acid-sensing ion channel 1A-like [Haliotis cracherodii]|uniref:acid-sensing ion channel 1A-like n=1 Tax=Haliotis cracherodii TaxID=6455 RepID=UPI0039EB1737
MTVDKKMVETPGVQTKMALSPGDKSPRAWRQVWTSFAEDTSLHACNYLAKTQRTRAERIWWLIIFFTMVTCLLYILGDLLTSYLRYPVITKSSVEYLPSMEFPTITFCNANGFNSSMVENSDVKEMFLWFNPILSRVIKRNTSSVLPSLKTRQDTLYKAMSLKKEDYVLLALFREQDVSLEMFDEISGNAGYCFRFNSEQMIRRHGAQTAGVPGPSGSLQLLLDIHQEHKFPGPHNQAAMMVYINHPSDKQSFLDPSIAVAPGTTAYISMTKHQYKFLPKPYKSFGADNCLDTDSPSFRNPLKYASTYSWDACISECLSHYTTTNCGCKTTEDPGKCDTRLSSTNCECKSIEDPVSLPYPYCTMEGFINCTLAYMQTIYINHTSQRELCNCEKPCRFFVYDTKLSYGAFPSMAVTNYMVENNFVPSAEYARQNLMHINIWYERMIIQKLEYEPEYTLNSIVGTLGGQMGFFLGASIVTLYELFEACVYSVKAFIKNRITRKQTHRTHPGH